MRTARLIGVALLLGAATSASRAQDELPQTIRMVVPFSPGGPVDALTRVVAQHLQTRLGRNVVVENRPGGGTSLGVKAVSTAPPDGATLLVIGPNVAYHPVLLPDLDFDPTTALTPIATLVTWSHVLAVAPTVPAQTIPELVAHAKAHPGTLAFGFGLATMPHIVGETFKKAAGIDLVDVPYRGGEGARADLLGGRIHINIAPAPQLLPLIGEGKIRALAYTGPQRSPDLPDVPTMTESGYPQVGFDPDVWMGVFGPAGLAAPLVQQLNRAVADVLRSPEMAPSLKRFGYEAKITAPDAFATFFAAELKKWPPILKATGLRPQ